MLLVKKNTQCCGNRNRKRIFGENFIWSYTAAKGGISALTHALAVSLAGADAVQQPVHRVGNPMDIANMVLFLCSEKTGFITGENICIDGGMTKQMIYHGDCGWTLDMSSDMTSKKID